MDVVAVAIAVVRPNHDAYHPALMVASRLGPGVDAVRRAASWGATGLGILLPLVILLSYAVVAPFSNHFLLALAATTLYLPLQVRHIRHSLRGARPRGLPCSLAVMGVAIIAPTPALGGLWLYSFHALVASVLVTLRPRLSLPVVACVLAAAAVWGHRFGGPLGNDVYLYMPAAVLQRAMVVAVLVWLVGALGRIQVARVALAEQALAMERSRLDDDISRTVGFQLENAVRRGELALELTRTGGAESQRELEALIQGSRAALAEARRLIGRYRLVASHTEVHKAASILHSAGIAVAVEVPEDALPPVLDEPLRASLRSLVAQLLADGASGPVVICLRRDAGEDRFAAEPAKSLEPAA
jgi:two-component system, NarL family, sensor histidine kinase DesK